MSAKASGGGGGSAGPCGACKFLRRKCVSGCIFAPYFDSEQGAVHFAAVHKVFGASNVSKVLLHIPPHKRLDAVVTICYEAQARLRDPVYGCVAHIFTLQQQVANLQAELSYLQTHLATLQLSFPSQQQPQPDHLLSQQQPLSISDLPSSPATLSTFFDLSTLFVDSQPGRQQQQVTGQFDMKHMERSGSSSSGGNGGGDLQALARELVDRHWAASRNIEAGWKHSQ
ncbi:putative LOB domain protein 18 [Zostera marina]|uniref:Putative LOB domain protein 18 n=1 Tax=Zostera marina TaxID=29655 RepID=A0A0K9PSQ9_ZOSMR|nr:putative LOB domain protein 18 [Zostera marina]